MSLACAILKPTAINSAVCQLDDGMESVRAFDKVALPHACPEQIHERSILPVARIESIPRKKAPSDMYRRGVRVLQVEEYREQERRLPQVDHAVIPRVHPDAAHGSLRHPHQPLTRVQARQVSETRAGEKNL